MAKFKRSLWIVATGACLLGAASLHAQEGSNVIGPPQLRDFSLQPKQSTVPQPDPNQRPAQVAPPPPAQTAPPPATEGASVSPPATRPAPAAQTRQAPRAEPVAPVAAQPAPRTPAPVPAAPPSGIDIPTVDPSPAAPESPAAPPAPGGTPWWLGAILVLGGLASAALLLRRRRGAAKVRAREPELVPAVPLAAPAAPRPDPVPRPWLELELKTERASFTAAEAVVAFELAISNSGGSPARNLRIDVKMFNAGREQDQEIGAFFRTAGREGTKLNLPGIGQDSTGVIRGEVAMPLDEMRAVKLDGRMLFIPVVAVNLLYDWGEGRTGHSAKSYVIGRELQDSPEKMGAFRVDQGPRIWRTVGQRPHTLAKRA